MMLSVCLSDVWLSRVHQA